MVVTSGLALSSAPASADESLPDLVTAKNIIGHLENLQEIAEHNGGNRADGTPGYDAAADYVIDQLETAGYTPRKHTYEFDRWVEHSTPEFSQTAPEQREFVHEDDFRTMTYSGSGEVAAPGAAVHPDSDASGCAAADFAEFPEGAVAIMRRGTCSFEEKATNAADAGASAAVLFNQGGGSEEETGAFNGTLSNPVGIPVVSTSTAVGEDLAAAGEGLEVRLAVDSEVSTESSYNIIADTDGGRDNNTVVVGAHLDSVPAGPGINDNGSGSAAILETAVQLGTLDEPTNDEPTNQVRFAFWGTEEQGLIGSTEYVEGLSEQERQDIALYLNFDMVGSPNFGRFVYDGRGEMEESMPPPAGSAAIQKLFEDYFAEQDLVSEPTALNGRSDYGAFLEAGIPSGGLFSGADGVKTEEQVGYYGGTAGEPFDPSYHTPDDDIDNINETAVEDLSGGIAYAVQTYADSTLPVNGMLHAQDITFDRQADLWLR
ncbi:Zn-dependent M28 family amino/carboxypeptidase [Lipingzhangella halophila]|uniref:Zn-dependent M28 family amino/carboxypeptidase n=1 Tax=Lipingzhangella halophila TaxID=1783352 RepID=A0A7W7W5D2_9ACTN|nr:M28 family peptidase [Lipingzhangella halophila]MBB4933719.1 Zn-dependent M28 family amino/carboxypeptidase [Lipingzhangella halophila]